MASVFKRKGQRVWTIKYFDHTGRRRERSSRTTDKRTADRIANELEAKAALRREGVIDPDLDEYVKEARRPLSEHIEDFHRHLKEKRSSSHVATQMARIYKLTKVCGMATTTGLTPDAVERGLAKLATDRKLDVTTRNGYLTALKTFCNWLVKQKRIIRNPIESVERLQAEETEHRRALSPDEASRLIGAAESGPTLTGRNRNGVIRWELDGQARGVLYRFACETGLRRSAIERLAVQDFDLGGKPTVTVKPKANTKSRTLLIIPLRDEVARGLRNHFAARLPGTKAFDMPAKWETADMLRTDLSSARAAWMPREPQPRTAISGLGAISWQK